MGMKHPELIAHALSKPGTVLKYPFDPAMPVAYVGSKLFALFSHLSGFPSMNLKADPEEAYLQRQQYPGTVIPGYHMNKRHWNTVLLNGIVPDAELLRLIDDSYILVWQGLPKREKELYPLSHS